MARYRKIQTQIWNDEKFRELSDRGKLLFLFILTHPSMTSLGAMRHTPAGLAAELVWSTEDLSEELSALTKSGMVEVDQRACCIRLPRFLKHNRPESVNVIKSWPAAMELIPQCGLKSLIFQQLEDQKDALPDSFLNAYLDLREDLRKTIRKSFQQGAGAGAGAGEKEFAANAARTPGKKSAPKKDRQPRKPDPVWDTVAELWFNGRVVESDKPRVGRLVKRFKEHEATPEAICERRDRYQREPPWKDLPCTPDAVLKHWDILAKDTNAKPRRVVQAPQGVGG